ncbi:MAG: hypothetical protein BMS9Abin17_0642 [Acidimicrobiia bacterium]|nr:MAG: hypothetical protein BMS9Abin17_0642 [Acidimicrobiia bacterium]
METMKAGMWKNLGAWLFIGFGGVISLASLPATSAPTVFLADVVLWPIDGGQALSAESRLLSAILGGVMLGFGTTLLVLVAKVYPRDPQLVRTVILAGVWVWFITDSLASIAAAAPLNALFNVGFLLAFLVPWRTVPANAQLTVSGS